MPNSQSNECSTIDLEIKLTYLEETLSELNNIVYKQQLSIDAQTKQIKSLLGRLMELEGGNKNTDLPHEKPPHY